MELQNKGQRQEGYVLKKQEAQVPQHPQEPANSGSAYYSLFKFFNQEHDLVLLDSDIQEIIYEVNKFEREHKLQEAFTGDSLI